MFVVPLLNQHVMHVMCSDLNHWWCYEFGTKSNQCSINIIITRYSDDLFQLFGACKFDDLFQPCGLAVATAHEVPRLL